MNELYILLQTLIGCTIQEAKDLCHFNGYNMQITQEDDKTYCILCDFKLDRIYVEVKHGKITNAYNG